MADAANELEPMQGARAPDDFDVFMESNPGGAVLIGYRDSHTMDRDGNKAPLALIAAGLVEAMGDQLATNPGCAFTIDHRYVEALQDVMKNFAMLMNYTAHFMPANKSEAYKYVTQIREFQERNRAAAVTAEQQPEEAIEMLEECGEEQKPEGQEA